MYPLVAYGFTVLQCSCFFAISSVFINNNNNKEEAFEKSHYKTDCVNANELSDCNIHHHSKEEAFKNIHYKADCVNAKICK